MCDTFVLLPDYTENKKFYFGKNSDRDPNEAHEVVIIPEKHFDKDELLKCTYISIPQVTKTNRVLLSKPVWIWGAEIGVNEYGVVIGNEAVFSKIPPGKEPGLIGMDYLRLGLERGDSAANALKIITTLLEEYGQSGNCGYMHPFYYQNSFIIADRHEAWKLETVGNHWIAEMITGFGAISNGYSIEENWDLISPDLISTAEQKGWKKKDQKFNFRESYSDWLITTFSDSKQRRSCSIRKINETGKKTEIKDVFSTLRSHRDEINFRPDKGISGADLCMHAGFGPIRVSQTTGSMVVEQDDNHLVVWVTGSSAPCLSIFKPMKVTQDENYFGQSPQLEYDPNSYWWQQERIHRKLLLDYQGSSKEYIQERNDLERDFLTRMENPDSQNEIIEKCFKDAIIFQQEWIEKLQKTEIKNKTNFLYSSEWKKNNQLAKFPKE
jgi:dipeptidase